jgi:hypothetical protein
MVHEDGSNSSEIERSFEHTRKTTLKPAFDALVHNFQQNPLSWQEEGNEWRRDFYVHNHSHGLRKQPTQETTTFRVKLDPDSENTTLTLCLMFDEGIQQEWFEMEDGAVVSHSEIKYFGILSDSSQKREYVRSEYWVTNFETGKRTIIDWHTQEEIQPEKMLPREEMINTVNYLKGKTQSLCEAVTL